MSRPGSFLRPGDMPASEIAASHINYLPLADQRFHRLPDLFPGRFAVNVVHLVQVDMISLKAFQAGFAGPQDVPCGKPVFVWPFSHAAENFRGGYYLIPAAATL